MRHTGPASWLLDHIIAAAQELWDDLATIAAYYRKPPLPQRTRTTSGWRAALPIGHPDYWCGLSTAQQREWADISKHLDMPPAVPQPRREQP